MWAVVSALVGCLVAVVLKFVAMRHRDRAANDSLNALAQKNAALAAETQRVLDSLWLFIGVLSPDGTVLEVNKAALNVAGINARDVIGKHVVDTYWFAGLPGSCKLISAAVADALAGHSRRFDMVASVANGRLITVDYMLVPIFNQAGQIDKLVASAIDITERLDTQRSLQNNEQMLAGITENLPGIAWTFWIDANNRYVVDYVSSGAARIIGLEPGQWVGDIDTFFSRVACADLAEFKALAAAPDAASFVLDLRVGDQQGQLRWLRANCTPLIDARARRVWNVLMVDITAQKSAEAALVVSTGRLKLAMQAATEGLWDSDLAGDVTYFDDAFKHILGYESREMPPHSQWYERFMHPGDVPRVIAAVERHFRGLAAYDEEFRMKVRDGSWRWFRARGQAQWDTHGQPTRLTGSIVDVDKRRKDQDSLQAALTDRDRLLARETMLLRELNHRVRNHLAGLFGLIAIYQRAGSSAEQLVEALHGKLFALKEVHDLTGYQSGLGVGLEQLVGCLADKLVGERYRPCVGLAGPRVIIPASQAAALAMVLQELFTNCHKHGPLRAPRPPGEKARLISIDWSLNPVDSDSSGTAAQRLQIVWTEHRQPTADRFPPASDLHPPTPGIGIKLIEGLCASDLRGSSCIRIGPEGFVATIACTLNADEPSDRLSELLSDTAQTTPMHPQPRTSTGLHP